MIKVVLQDLGAFDNLVYQVNMKYSQKDEEKISKKISKYHFFGQFLEKNFFNNYFRIIQ